MTREERINEALSPILAKMREHGATDEMCQIYSNGFHVGAMWADADRHWISVEDDGNPIDTGWYIFTTGKIVDVGYYLGGNEWRDVHPTHWMHLSPPPIITSSKKGGEG